MELGNDVVAEVLEKAADLYEAEKVEWCQSHWSWRRDNQLSMCAEGALLHAAGCTYKQIAWAEETGGPEYLRGYIDPVAWAKFIGASEAIQHHTGLFVLYWNDSNGRTKEQVIDTFKEVAKDLRNGK